MPKVRSGKSEFYCPDNVAFSMLKVVLPHHRSWIPRCTNNRFRTLVITIFSATLLLMAPVVLALEELGSIDIAEPMDGPGTRALGWQWHYVDQDGNMGFMEKVASGADSRGNELASYVRTDGCEWTRQVKGLAPAIEWKNCPSTGKAKVDFVSGTIWPLMVGNSFSYSVKGQSSLLARAWGTRRKCTVTDTVRVRIVSGDYDTYKVVCNERFGTRTWWFAPKVGTAIAYLHKPSRGEMILQEYTHIKTGELQ